MILIAAADRNWGIGKDGGLLAHIPEDMKFFAAQTTGQVIVMGRKTLESFPGGKPLKNRVNIVITHDREYDGKGAVVVHSARELEEETGNYPGRRIYVAGGGTIYRMLLPLCSRALITRIEHQFDADTFMPDLDREEGWILEKKGDEKEYGEFRYHFDSYVNQAAGQGKEQERKR